MIQLDCPHCGHLLRVDDRYAGKQGTCKACGNAITVPRSSQQSPPQQRPPQQQPHQAAAPVATDPDAPMSNYDLANLDIDVDRKSSRPVIANRGGGGGGGGESASWAPMLGWGLFIAASLTACGGMGLLSTLLWIGALIFLIYDGVQREIGVGKIVLWAIGSVVLWFFVYPIYLLSRGEDGLTFGRAAVGFAIGVVTIAVGFVVAMVSPAGRESMARFQEMMDAAAQQNGQPLDEQFGVEFVPEAPADTATNP